MITQAFCDQAKLDFLGGLHQPGDTYMLALYTSAAVLDKTTTAYTASGEASGTGYVAGGMALTGYTRALSGDVAYLSFDNPAWLNATITARGALIYNASRGDAAIAVYDFGADFSSSNGTFTPILPAPGSNAVVRIA